MQKSEDQLVRWIADRFGVGDADSAGGPSDAVPIGIGDDMALIRADGNLLLAADMLMDGVDFDSRAHTPAQMGRKALAVNLSDCAAMAIRPRYALVSVALPNDWTMEQAQGLYLGIEQIAEEFGVRIIGGDTNSWDKPLVIDVNILGEPWPGVAPVRRSGVMAGDAIVVTGELGGSIAGHHIDFVPRVHEARQLAESLGRHLHAMMDISDGLSTDAARMGRASGVGIELSPSMLDSVASPVARELSASGGRPLVDHVLNDGEDFELLFAVEADAWRTYSEGLKSGGRLVPGDHIRCTEIGRAIAEPGFWLADETGQRAAVESRGWQHFK